jgi:very-short-patch-repair endonuclease
MSITETGPDRLYRAADLRRLGWSKRRIARAVTEGALISVRRGVYMHAAASGDCVLAARAAGRLGCVSVLRSRGVFVLRSDEIHLHFERGTRKCAAARGANVWHWKPLLRTPHPRATAVHLIDAIAQVVECQAPRAAIATIDSALHLRLIDEDDLDEIFTRVSPRRRVLRRFVDGRAESGTETLVRLIALMLGFEVESQRKFPGVGRVDLVLDGWLVVECDSAQFHSGWEAQKRDRRRDVALAALGLVSLHIIAEDILYHPERVIESLRRIREARRRGFVGVPEDC